MNRQQRADRLAHATARTAAAATVREAIQQAAVVAFGATVHEGPIDRVGVLDDPLAGVAAARLALGVAETQMQRYALTARAAGRSWDDVAAALELPEHTTDSSEHPVGVPRAQTAFEWLIEDQPSPLRLREWWQRPMASWRCSTCRNRVLDHGPFESHPDDREHGHAADCARHRAALEAWRREQDDDGHERTDEQDECDEQDEHDHEDGGGGGRR